MEEEEEDMVDTELREKALEDLLDMEDLSGYSLNTATTMMTTTMMMIMRMMMMKMILRRKNLKRRKEQRKSSNMKVYCMLNNVAFKRVLSVPEIFYLLFYGNNSLNYDRLYCK